MRPAATPERDWLEIGDLLSGRFFLYRSRIQDRPSFRHEASVLIWLGQYVPDEVISVRAMTRSVEGIFLAADLPRDIPKA